MKRIYLCIFSMLFIFQSFSQTFDISGKVIDQQKKPIPFAHITNLNQSLSVVCDVSGNFKMKIVKIPTILKASAVGFESLEFNISIKNYKAPITFL